MRISAKPIVNYANINSFSFGNQWMIRAGDPNRLYFQLVDLDQTDNTMCKAPLRYLAQPTGADPIVITVTFPSIDDATQIQVQATQVTGDASLWYVDLTAAQIPGSGAVQFAINDNGIIRRFGVLSMISVEYPDNDGSC